MLVEPDGVPQQSLSTLATARMLRLWSAADDAPPAAPAPGLGRDRRPRPLDPEDLSDESDRFWRGRSFALARTLDPNTGLPADELRVTREDGSRLALSLPGEACGQPGRFGRPHYRMAADGRSGLDLRFVDGGCHAVRIDLETGAWQKLDAASAPATCETARRIPAANLSVALRGYMREVESALVEGGADPAAAFVLEIAEDGEATARARDFSRRPPQHCACRASRSRHRCAASTSRRSGSRDPQHRTRPRRCRCPSPSRPERARPHARRGRRGARA